MAQLHIAPVNLLSLSVLEKFEAGTMSRGSEIGWPPSPDPNPLDFWFCGRARAHVFKMTPPEVEDLKKGCGKITLIT